VIRYHRNRGRALGLERRHRSFWITGDMSGDGGKAA
jgi:hypothetical protein